METLLDISKMSIEEVTGTLKGANDVEPTPPKMLVANCYSHMCNGWKGTRHMTKTPVGEAPTLTVRASAMVNHAVAAARATWMGTAPPALVVLGQMTSASVATREATGLKSAVENSWWMNMSTWPKAMSPH